MPTRPGASWGVTAALTALELPGQYALDHPCQTEGGGPKFTRNPSVWQTTSNVPSIVSCPPGSFVVDGGMWTSNTP